MCAVKKPVRSTVTLPKVDSPKVMDSQNRRAGDSKAVRTARLSWTTTPDMAKAIDDAAYARRISKSQLMEDAMRVYLGL